MIYTATNTAIRRAAVALQGSSNWGQRSVRWLSFSFAGPKKLHDVLKKELVENKTASEVADIWLTYHESKEGVIGMVLNGADGKAVLARAASSPFFVQPVFREEGFFTLVSQFQSPSHFLLAYLEDYKMDPHAASPLVTFSVFDDYADSKDITLVRADVLNKSIEKEETLKVVQSLLDNYRKNEEYGAVKIFNDQPDVFDFDDHISRMNKWWKDGLEMDTTAYSTTATTTPTNQPPA